MKSNTLINIVIIIFVLIFAVSCFFLLKEIVERRLSVGYASSLHNEYVPTIPQDSTLTKPDIPENDTEDTTVQEPVDTSNPTIQRLQEKYPDVVGWLTVDGAEITHPFVQSYDNAAYLWTDLDGYENVGGTLFMDYRNSRDFSDKLTIIYGHNMRDGTMFGQLLNYLDFDYLLANPDVYISFPDYTAHYTIAACFVVDGADNPIYERIGTKTDIQDLVDYIYDSTTVNPDTPLDGNNDILVLSTCNRDYETARTLLICIPD